MDNVERVHFWQGAFIERESEMLMSIEELGVLAIILAYFLKLVAHAATYLERIDLDKRNKLISIVKKSKFFSDALLFAGYLLKFISS